MLDEICIAAGSLEQPSPQVGTLGFEWRGGRGMGCVCVCVCVGLSVLSDSL